MCSFIDVFSVIFEKLKMFSEETNTTLLHVVFKFQCSYVINLLVQISQDIPQPSGRGLASKENYQQDTGVFGAVSVFGLRLTSPRSTEPCAAVGPEMNAQYLNLAYLVLSLHPVGSAWQHNHKQ